MPKEILIYDTINEWSAAEFIEDINEALEIEPEAELVVRINCDGGSPECAWGMIAKFQELTNSKKVKNDGKAYSMGLYFNCYVENASALDVTQFVLHRAAYPSYIESSESCFTEGMKKNLELINKNLRKALEAKIDIEKFENLKSVKEKGITLDQVFSMDSRIDVVLTAQEAKKIGLINEIITITPSIKAEIESYEGKHKAQIAAKYEKPKPKIETKKSNTMTIAELKKDHPELFAQAVAMGVTDEKARVKAFMAFHVHDPEGVTKAIADGTEFTPTAIAEFSAKALSNLKLKGIEAETVTATTTAASEAVVKTESELAIEAFKADLAKGV